MAGRARRRALCARSPRRVLRRAGRGEVSEPPDSDSAAADEAPRPGDPWLFVGDVLVCGVFVPNLVVLLLVKTRIYTPLWLLVGNAAGQGIIASSLAHGAGIAASWVCGGLATQAYADDAVDPRDAQKTLLRAILAWAVSVPVMAAFAAINVASLGIPLDGVTEVFPRFFSFLASGAQQAAGITSPLDYRAQVELLRAGTDLALDVMLVGSCMAVWRLSCARSASP